MQSAQCSPKHSTLIWRFHLPKYLKPRKILLPMIVLWIARNPAVFLLQININWILYVSIYNIVKASRYNQHNARPLTKAFLSYLEDSVAERFSNPEIFPITIKLALHTSSTSFLPAWDVSAAKENFAIWHFGIWIVIVAVTKVHSYLSNWRGAKVKSLSRLYNCWLSAKMRSPGWFIVHCHQKLYLL